MTADPSLKSQKLKAGTLKRIFTYATQYKKHITLFLATVIIDAILIVTTPLLLRKLIDQGVIPKNGALITQLALLVGGLAVLDALFNMEKVSSMTFAANSSHMCSVNPLHSSPVRRLVP
jgi:ATP-binding cassette subfamily B protein